MKQKLTKALDGLDPATRRAAQAAAAAAGMPLEEWLDQAVGDQAGLSDRSRPAASPARADVQADEVAVERQNLAQLRAEAERRSLDNVVAASAASERRVRETVEKTAIALDSVAAWIERAENRFGETSRATVDSQERTASLVSDTIAMVTRRLDDIERKFENGEHASISEAVKAIERMEGRLSASGAHDHAEQGAQIEAALRGFEERISGLTERLSTLGPRPLGRRGIPAGAELRSAITEIRSRQFELDQPQGSPAARPAASDEALTSLRDELARLSSRFEQGRPGEGELAALRAEITELHDAIRPLARRDDVNSLENSIKALASDVSLARSSGKGPAAIMAPLETLQGEVRRLVEEIAPETYGQIARNIDRLADKLDLAAGAGVDPSAIESLSDQLTDMRALLGAIPGPDQIGALTQQVAALARESSELKTRQIDAGDFASVKQAIEEIRTTLAASPRGGRGAAKLDDLKNTVAPIQSELERLSRRFEGFVEGGHPALFDEFAVKLDRIEENVRRSGAGLDLRESLLQQLAEKLEKAERPGAGRDAMEALERQIEAIAGRLDRGLGGDPALASLERVMNDLMTQVGTLRDGTLEAAELAARNAVAGTLSALPQKIGGSANGDIGALKRDMTDIKAYQGLADKRTQGSLDTLQTTLDKLLRRLESGDDQTLPALQSSAPSRPRFPPDESQSIGARINEKTKIDSGVSEPIALRSTLPSDEILLEPGAGRPGHEPSAPGEGTDIRASFIAKARRAAQAAASEAAAEERARVPARAAPLGVPPKASASASRQPLKVALAKHGRPILIGIAAVVLVLGSFQIYRNAQRSGGSTVAIHDGTTTLPNPIAGAPSSEGADPRTTQSIGGSATVLTAPSVPPLPESRAPSAMAFTPSGVTEPATTSAMSKPDAPKADSPKADVPKVDVGKSPAIAESAAKAEPKPAEPSQLAAIGKSDTAAPARPLRPVPEIGASDLPASLVPASLRQAALAGDPAALYELGLRVTEGRGMQKDAKLAAKLFERSAAQGLGPAQYRVGSLYEKGVGVTRDLEAARYWYQRGAEAGNTRSMHNLAVLLAEGGTGSPDYSAALEWFKRAAEYGVRDSQFNLGVLLARGLGTQQDLSRAYTWFAIAAMQGDEDAARKRDEVGARMAAGDLTTAKLAAERWRARTAAQSANEVPPPAGGSSDIPAKRTGRDGRV